MSVIYQAGRARMSPLGLTFLAIASVGWGLNFPIMKHLLTEWPPLSSRGLCGIVGAAALALIAVARQQQLSVPSRMWLRLLLVSTLQIGGWVAFMGLALLWLSASEAAILGISIPVWVALGTVLTKHFLLSIPPISLAAWQIGLGCLPIVIIGLAVEHPQLAALSTTGWASMLYMTIIQFCLSYVCWFAALERLPAATASIGTLLVPVVGVLAAAAMLHEPLGLREIGALVVTLGGVAMALRS
jgi:probable blue pigment (indigoidine) exporter